MFMGLDLHTTETIEAGREALDIFDAIMQVGSASDHIGANISEPEY